MKWQKDQFLYEGKAKNIYTAKGEKDFLVEDFLVLEHKDFLTAFNGEKKEQLEGKGQINLKISSFIFKYLKEKEIPNHYVDDDGDRNMLTRKCEILPLEVVVRNLLAGSTAKKFALKDGTPITQPLVEFFYKNDDLSDPFINEAQATIVLKIAEEDQLKQIKQKALVINKILVDLFDKANICLVDFKLEFGTLPSGELILADEISPDSCRLWDKQTQEKMDKDRFRLNLGDVLKFYKEIYNRIRGKDCGRKK